MDKEKCMKILNKQEYGLLTHILSLSQNSLKKVLTTYLKKHYDNVTATKDYVVAEGSIPVALVAHLDTVFEEPPNESNIYYDQRKGIMWSSMGAGFDDRAGIYAIVNLIQKGYRPHVILTTDEEQGGLGAQALAKSAQRLPQLNFMIQLDRKGSNDCVFYDCITPEFIQYISSFGFAEAVGSYSDISFLMPVWKTCGVNLSIGYQNEHTTSETLNVTWLFNIIQKVENILKQKEFPTFEYKQTTNALLDYFCEYEDMAYGAGGDLCHCCGKYFFDFELFPAKSKDKKVIYYCGDCAPGRVNWCKYCNCAYEVVDLEKDEDVCSDCMEVMNAKRD